MQKFEGRNYKSGKKIPLTKEEHEELGKFINDLSHLLVEWDLRLAYAYPDTHPLRKKFGRAVYDLIHNTCFHGESEYYKMNFEPNSANSPYYGNKGIKPGWRP